MSRSLLGSVKKPEVTPTISIGFSIGTGQTDVASWDMGIGISGSVPLVPMLPANGGTGISYSMTLGMCLGCTVVVRYSHRVLSTFPHRGKHISNLAQEATGQLALRFRPGLLGSSPRSLSGAGRGRTSAPGPGGGERSDGDRRFLRGAGAGGRGRSELRLQAHGCGPCRGYPGRASA